MFKYNVRCAKCGDAASVYNLSAKILGSKLDRESFDAVYRSVLNRPEQTVLVVIHSGRIVGYIHARQVNNLYEEAHTEVEGYALYEYYRENNAAGELFGALEKWSVQMVSKKIVLKFGAYTPDVKGYLLENGFRESAPGCYEKYLF